MANWLAMTVMVVLFGFGQRLLARFLADRSLTAGALSAAAFLAAIMSGFFVTRTMMLAL